MTAWPWLIGLTLLLFALWGVAWMLNPEDEIADPARLSTEGVEVPDPVVVPAPANQ
ncbi:MAG TPA: hypothetical protein VMN78_09285 [Longimicrobiales bacterium]|nr:hypothetical protein [Longimicrobiales bacterium]